jgi:outer membrane protein assembly factor BamB
MLRNLVRPILVLSAALALVAVSSCKNRPPETPPAPDGPASVYPGQQNTYAAVATDPNGDNVAVRFNWGDSISDWTDYSTSGTDITLSHAWADTGTFQVMAQARDRKLAESDWSAALPVQVLPRPEVPAIPIGPALCFKDTSYTFESVTTDRFGDSVSIRFDWGSDTSDWSPFVASGETVAASYNWPQVGQYKVTAQARDPKLHVTGWSDGHNVEVIQRLGPNPPLAPSGPTRGGAGPDSIYDFTAYGTHPQDLLVAIRFDWGDGDTSAWGDFLAPNQPTTMGHAWLVAGTFAVRAQAKDTGNALSAWSVAHTILIRPPDTLRIWRYPIKEGAPASDYSSPAIGPDGTIYVGSQDDYLFALNADGTLKWRFQTGDVVRSSPAIGADGTIYVGSYDNHLYAINPSDGTPRWSYLTGGNVPSSPAIAADGTIIFGSSDNKIYALNPDSSLKWSYTTSGQVYSSPAIAPDGTIYCGSNDRYFYCLNSDGSLRWRRKCGREVQSSPAIAADGTVYVGADDGVLYALNPDSTLKWSVATNGQIQSSPAIAPDGTIYFGSTDHLFYALNPDGSTRWRYVTDDKIYSSPAINANGTVFFGSDDNNLYALGADSTPVWLYPTDNDIESSPTIGPDGKIYFLSNDGYLYALKGYSPLSGGNWPKFRHDIKNNGRVGAKR